MSVVIGSRNHIDNSIIGDGTHIFQAGGKVVIDGKELPPCPTKGKNCTIINNKVFIDGYEWKDNKWQKTLRALYHKWF